MISLRSLPLFNVKKKKPKKKIYSLNKLLSDEEKKELLALQRQRQSADLKKINSVTLNINGQEKNNKEDNE